MQFEEFYFYVKTHRKSLHCLMHEIVVIRFPKKMGLHEAQRMHKIQMTKKQ